MIKKLICFLVCCCVLHHVFYGQQIILEKNEAGAFPVATTSSGTAAIILDEKDDPLIHIAAGLFQQDIEGITGKKLSIGSFVKAGTNIILIGNIHNSQFIKQLIKEKKIIIDNLKNKWEGYQVQIVKAPFAGVKQALVIAGSDRRGTAYGVFELSKQMGVSPWYWWADVPVKKKKELYIKAKSFLTDAPTIKYRGIFINDEAPALSGWSKEKFGGFNHTFYEKVFELMLRLKANYLWPAMWGNAFYDDDPLNIRIADEYGIVIGTSHHEPLMRAHDEWRRYGKGKWNYDSNEVRLKEFWKEGMQRATNEKIVSIGMRGDGDEPMSRETATNLLERIVKDQRKIIEEVTGKPASQTPQLWALYKEVQDYYDKGMRVPDDVTLLLCDDNWGNIRKLPKLNEPKRKGGYGIYYHFDYVGGPRNYKWINTNNIARVWEQMHLAYEYGVDKIWIVNVGDIKPMELPVSFFLDYAWDTKKWNEDNLGNYFTQWAAELFGATHAKDIGDILRKYSQYASRRKPELLDENTYSLSNSNYEADRIVNEWNELLVKAEKINKLIAVEYKDAFFELVLHPVKAFTNLQQLYSAIAWNKYYGSMHLEHIQGAFNAIAPLVNKQADNAKQFYINDSLLSLQYNNIANGKWNHMMDQTHIGYTYWQQPPINKMPQLIVYALKDSPKNGAIDIEKKVIKSITFENQIPKSASGNYFYEKNGYISIQSDHFTKPVNTSSIHWKVIPDIGKDGNGVTTFPVTEIITTRSSSLPPHLEYEIYSYDTGVTKIQCYFSPTLNFHNDDGLKYAISVDDEKPQVISINKEDNNVSTWEEWVANNIIIKNTSHTFLKPGKHTVKYWMVSPAVILQKIVIDFGGVKQSYLGPPETRSK